MEHLYLIMPLQSPHPDTTPVVRNVRSLANPQNQQQPRPSGISQLPPAGIHVSILAGKRDSSQGGSSVASTIQGQNSTLSSSLNNSRFADITQCVTSSPAATHWRSISTLTTTPGTSSRSIPAPEGTSQTDTTGHIVCSSPSGIASTPTPLRGLEILPTCSPNREACAIITNPLPTWAIESNQRQRQWQFEPQAVSIPRSMVSVSRTIHRFFHSDMMRYVFATGRSWSSTCGTDGCFWVQATWLW